MTVPLIIDVCAIGASDAIEHGPVVIVEPLYGCPAVALAFIGRGSFSMFLAGEGFETTRRAQKAALRRVVS